jgi:hypothetical protein
MLSKFNNNLILESNANYEEDIPEELDLLQTQLSHNFSSSKDDHIAGSVSQSDNFDKNMLLLIPKANPLEDSELIKAVRQS